MGAEASRNTDPEWLRNALVDSLVKTGAIGSHGVESASGSAPAPVRS